MVCPSVAIVSPVRTAEPIEMPFGMWTWVGAKEPCIGWGSRSPLARDNFRGKGPFIVKHGDYGPCAAAMRPFVK